jgi:hypothetical protein
MASKIPEISEIIFLKILTFMLSFDCTKYEVIYQFHPNKLDVLAQWENPFVIFIGRFSRIESPVWCVCCSRLRKDSSVLRIASMSGKLTLPPLLLSLCSYSPCVSHLLQPKIDPQGLTHLIKLSAATSQQKASISIFIRLYW